MINRSHAQLGRFGNSFSVTGARILEIGAGRGELFQFIKSDFREYLMTDISEWGLDGIQKILESDSRVRFELQNIEKLGYPDNVMDWVIATCVVAHVDEPYLALLELRRVTKIGGVLTFEVSADPGILLRFARKLLVKRKMRGLQIPYELSCAISHRNPANSILEMLKFVFLLDEVQITYYPLHIRSWNLSTHIIVNVVKKTS